MSENISEKSVLLIRKPFAAWKEFLFADSLRSLRLGGECGTARSPRRREGREENAKKTTLVSESQPLPSSLGHPVRIPLPSLVELRVDEKAVPEALQEMKDQPLFPVKKAQSDEVAIEPVQECAEKQGLPEVYRCP